MTGRREAVAAVLLAGAAQGHEASGIGGGFINGRLHLVFGFDHEVAIVAVSRCGAFLSAPLIQLMPVMFPMVMAFGASVVLDNGSTAWFIAEALGARRGLTVATPSLEMARALATRGDRHTVMMPGGTLRSSDMTLVSASAPRFAAQLHPDYLVVSMAALSARGGSSPASRGFDSHRPTIAG